MSLNGFIKIHRKIQDWGWYSDPNTKIVFLDLLLTANFKDTVFRGKVIHPGQTVFGRKALAERLGISERNVRTALNHLKSTNEITIETTNRFSIVTIVNWELYQLTDDEVTNETTNEVTNNRPASDQQVTSNRPHLKNGKNGKNGKNKDIYSRETAEIIDYLNEVCGTSYQPKTKETKKLIHARLSDGFTVEDFKAVIYKKAKQWKDDPKMCGFLRPQTLFGTKFEAYLNEKAALTFEERLRMA